jgi:hypothetical protein
MLTCKKCIIQIMFKKEFEISEKNKIQIKKYIFRMFKYYLCKRVKKIRFNFIVKKALKWTKKFKSINEYRLLKTIYLNLICNDIPISCKNCKELL